VRGGFVVLELPPDRVVRRQLTLPAQARAFLGGIVQNQIDRLSPWKSDQASYGFAVQPGEAGAGLAVTVLIASRAAMEAAVRRPPRQGSSSTASVARDGSDAGVAAIPLWSRRRTARPPCCGRARLAAGAAVLAIVGLTVGVSVWAVMSADARAPRPRPSPLGSRRCSARPWRRPARRFRRQSGAGLGLEGRRALGRGPP
jgi:general secretion pathway protein L